MTAPLDLGTRLWFSFACFLRVLLDASFAGRVWAVREEMPALPAGGAPASSEPVAERPRRSGPLDTTPTSQRATRRASELPTPTNEDEAPSTDESPGGVAAKRSDPVSTTSPSAAERVAQDDAARPAAKQRAITTTLRSIPVAGLPPSATDLQAARHDGALLLLALLQRDGRLVDFLEQDVATFTDGDVGAAARVVHEGCRKVLRGHVEVEPVRGDEEGARVEVPAGYDAASTKLVGDVRGKAPFTGTLRHKGWRAKKVSLPAPIVGHDPRVLAPAEVEL